MKYTRKKDMDGNKIFEGDSIIFYYGIPMTKAIGKVVFKKRRFYVETPGHNPKGAFLTELIRDYEIERVIEKR